jgi:hypothetical protein
MFNAYDDLFLDDLFNGYFWMICLTVPVTVFHVTMIPTLAEVSRTTPTVIRFGSMPMVIR